MFRNWKIKTYVFLASVSTFIYYIVGNLKLQESTMFRIGNFGCFLPVVITIGTVVLVVVTWVMNSMYRKK